MKKLQVPSTKAISTLIRMACLTLLLFCFLQDTWAIHTYIKNGVQNISNRDTIPAEVQMDTVMLPAGSPEMNELEKLKVLKKQNPKAYREAKKNVKKSGLNLGEKILFGIIGLIIAGVIGAHLFLCITDPDYECDGQ